MSIQHTETLCRHAMPPIRCRTILATGKSSLLGGNCGFISPEHLKYTHLFDILCFLIDFIGALYNLGVRFRCHSCSGGWNGIPYWWCWHQSSRCRRTEDQTWCHGSSSCIRNAMPHSQPNHTFGCYFVLCGRQYGKKLFKDWINCTNFLSFQIICIGFDCHQRWAWYSAP